MPSEWPEVPADQFCLSVRDGTHDSPKPVATGRYLVTSRHITGGRLDLASAYRISQVDFDAVNERSKVDRWDVLVSMIGTVGQPHLVKEKPDFAIKNIGLFKSKGETEGKWLYYYLKSPYAQQLIREQARGTTQAYIPLNALREFPIPLPDDTRVMRTVTDTLGALDDKIELNRKMNETLEQMARAIFESWFVDFEPFSDKGMTDSPLGMIPKGWEVRAVGDVADRVAMGPFGSSIKVDTFVPEGVPIISGQHLWGIMLDDSDYNFVTPEHADRLINANVHRGDVVFTHAGSIGQVAWIPENSKYERYVISQRQFYMTCDLAKMSPSYVAYYFSSPEGRHKLLANTSSSGVPSIARPVTYLRSIQMPVPPRRVLDEFENVVRPVHLQMRSHVAQSRALAAIRDALLPKLMSGKMRVNEATRFRQGVGA